MWENVDDMGRYSLKEPISSHLSVLANFFAIRAVSVGNFIDPTGPSRCRIGPKMSVDCTAPLELVQYTTTITGSLDHHSLMLPQES